MKGLRLSRGDWPPWWDWELDLSPHLFKRTDDRRFTEIDLRRMLERASGHHRDVVEGQWVIETRHRSRKPWEVIVEQDAERQLLVVVTATIWEQ